MIRNHMISTLASLGLATSAFATQSVSCTAEGYDARSPDLKIRFLVGALGSLVNNQVTVFINGKATRHTVLNFWLDENSILLRASDDQALSDTVVLRYNHLQNSGTLWVKDAIPAGQDWAPKYPVTCEM